jgi:hypothetical protein
VFLQLMLTAGFGDPGRKDGAGKLWQYPVIHQPEPLPGKDNKAEYIFYSGALPACRQAGMLAG